MTAITTKNTINKEMVLEERRHLIQNIFFKHDPLICIGKTVLFTFSVARFFIFPIAGYWNFMFYMEADQPFPFLKDFQRETASFKISLRNPSVTASQAKTFKS